MVNKKLDALTALRFIAAAAIVTGHLSDHFPVAAPIAVFPWGYGVSFFFVLSGFILKYVYSDLSRPGAVRTFFVARIARIWPLHLAALAFFLAFVPSSIWLIQNSTGSRLNILLAQIFLVQSLVPKVSYVFSFNAVSWSISTEMFFYLAFPFLLHKWDTTWRWKFAAVIVIAASILTITTMLPIAYGPANPSEVGAVPFGYMFPATRIVEFMLGMIAATAFQNIRPSGTALKWTLLEIATIAALPVCYFLLSGAPAAIFGVGLSSTSWSMYARTAACAPAFAVLILVFAFQKGGISNLVSARPLVLLGEASYALYLVHYSLLIMLSVYQGWLPAFSQITYIALYVSACIAASFALWFLVEMPSRRAIKRLVAGHNRPSAAVGNQSYELPCGSSKY
ncbi:acyltransferase family protein [Bradyrhizobium sp. McL0616]|uniref:acyltransferase family protein n=1 Tax=Bradyrhizobium sp. McL0616 TaxID=3415674 RepID=UPI003CFA0086